jgi:RNA polymerase sigma-54 factor
MKPALSLKQSQRLTMTPQLQQAIRLLQMNTAELSEELLHAHETNPLLEMEEAIQRQEIAHNDDVIEIDSSDESRESYNADWVSAQPGSRSSTPALRERSGFDIPDTSVATTLKQSLTSQLTLLGISPEQHRVTDHIIQYIDDAGYLEIPIEEIHEELNAETICAFEQVAEGLDLVQSLDPPGVGAAGPEDGLLLQLNSLEENFPGDETVGNQTARDIICHHLPLLAERNYKLLQRKLGVGEQELKQAVDLIRHLNPHPGYSVGQLSVNYITPDIIVEHRKGVWLARLNTGALPRVAINRDYQELITENSRSEKFSKMREQLQGAKWLLSNIEKRHSTILAVGSQIVERQQAFFERGPVAMKPMILKDVAEALDIHESTVSRATSGKYMLTPLGMFELKYFFSPELGSENGVGRSAIAIQTLISDLIKQESAFKPISDMKICQTLKNQGIEVARRTVAKYREQLNIPSSSKRKIL